MIFYTKLNLLDFYLRIFSYFSLLFSSVIVFFNVIAVTIVKVVTAKLIRIGLIKST